MKVRWTKQARRDLQGIHRYIAEDSPSYAAQVIDTILEAEDWIDANPTAGSLIKERPRNDVRQVTR